MIFDDEFETLTEVNPEVIDTKNEINNVVGDPVSELEKSYETHVVQYSDVWITTPIDTQPISAPIIFDPKEKLKELITLYEQPSILHDIELIEIPNIENIEKY